MPNVSALSPRDINSVLDLAERTGWQRERFKIELLFEVGPAFGIRDENAQLIASVMMPTYENDGFVAMMMVDPRFQRRGLGEKLLTHAMASREKSLFLYATQMGEPLYRKLGFHTLPGVDKFAASFHSTAHVNTERTPAEISHILELDAAVSGFKRNSALVRILATARSIATRKNGFAVRWNNGHLDIIGPVVAQTETQAIELVDEVLEGCDSLARIDVNVQSTQLAAHVQLLGFQNKGRSPFMTWPTVTTPGIREHYHAIALQALG